MGFLPGGWVSVHFVETTELVGATDVVENFDIAIDATTSAICNRVTQNTLTVKRLEKPGQTLTSGCDGAHSVA
jgi:hypothetical protein